MEGSKVVVSYRLNVYWAISDQIVLMFYPNVLLQKISFYKAFRVLLCLIYVKICSDSLLYTKCSTLKLFCGLYLQFSLKVTEEVTKIKVKQLSSSYDGLDIR